MTAGRYCTFDDSHWPLLFLRVRGGASNQEFEEYLATSLSYLRRGEPHVVVADLLQVTMHSAEQRRKQEEWMARNDALLREYLLGNAFVVDAPFIRLGLNILFYVKAPPSPYLIVPRLEPALVWAADRLEARGLQEPAERIRRRFGSHPTWEQTR